jgi:hypothetical protein
LAKKQESKVELSSLRTARGNGGILIAGEYKFHSYKYLWIIFEAGEYKFHSYKYLWIIFEAGEHKVHPYESPENI